MSKSIFSERFYIWYLVIFYVENIIRKFIDWIFGISISANSYMLIIELFSELWNMNLNLITLI